MSQWFVFDDLIPAQYQDFLCAELDPRRLTWEFLKDITYVDVADKAPNPAFQHYVFSDGKTLSTAYYVLLPLLYLACERHGLTIKELVRIKINLFPNRNKLEPNLPHVDFDAPHWVMLYYPFDSDGDTIFYADSTAAEELGRVSPKKGRVLLFDGSLRHSSSNPMLHPDRVTVNYNFTV